MKKVMKGKSACEKYGLAITDYILDEEMDIPKEELFNHLASCDSCRKDLANWRDTYMAMQNKAYMEKPETKKKYDEMLNRVKASTGSAKTLSQCSSSAKLPDGVDININLEYGWYAGTLWQHLAANGPAKIEEVPKILNTDADKAKIVSGWLMGEKKICLRHAKDAQYIYLTKDEQEKFRQINGKSAGQIDSPNS